MTTDKEMLDWLERMANQRGGLLLHDGTESGRCGLGLKTLNRTLREAIADAMQVPRPPRKASTVSEVVK